MLLIWLGSLVGGAGVGTLVSALFLGTYPETALPLAIISVIIAIVAFIISIGLAFEGVDEALIPMGTACIFGVFTAVAVLGFHTANTFDVNVGPLAWVGGFITLIGGVFTFIGWKTEN